MNRLYNTASHLVTIYLKRFKDPKLDIPFYCHFILHAKIYLVRDSVPRHQKSTKTHTLKLVVSFIECHFTYFQLIKFPVTQPNQLWSSEIFKE